jgi:hypothetical protein
MSEGLVRLAGMISEKTVLAANPSSPRGEVPAATPPNALSYLVTAKAALVTVLASPPAVGSATDSR